MSHPHIVMQWKNRLTLCVQQCVPNPNVIFKTATSHTLGWPATPGSIREAGTLVVSTQNVGVFTEKLNGLCTSSCVRSRSVVAIEQFWWRGTPDSACLACMSMYLREKKEQTPIIWLLYWTVQTSKMKTRRHLVKRYLLHIWELCHSMCH